MRLAIVILALVALSCTKKEEAPSADTEPAAETGAAGENAEPGAEDRAAGAFDKEKMAAEAEKMAKEIAADLAAAGEDVPEALQGEVPPVGAPPIVEVLEPGQDPKQPLRFEIPPGLEQDAKLDVGMTVSAVVAMLLVGNPEYVVVFDLSMRAEKPDKKGVTPVTFTVNDAQIDPAMLAKDDKQKKMLVDSLETARTFKGSYGLTADGAVIDPTVEVPDGALKHAQDMADNLRLALIQLTPPLPKAPLGKGAKWTARQAFRQGGLLVHQQRTFELVSREGNTAELAVDVRQVAPTQPWESQGTNYDLETLVGTANGHMTWNATKLVPVAAAIDGEVIKGLRFTQEGQALGLAVKTDRTIDVGEAARSARMESRKATPDDEGGE